MSIAGKETAFAEKWFNKLEELRGDGTAVSFAIYKDGGLYAAAASGTQDGDTAHPVSVDDLFNIGSVSKVYCAMAVLKLVEMGKVELDEPIHKYMPRFTMADERYRQITVRQCLNHTSGLPGTGYYASFMTEATDKKIFIDAFYKYLAMSVLKADPGEYAVYCNDGFIMCQIMVEEVSGMGYTEFVQKYLMAPIGAVSTCSGENNPTGRTRVKMRGGDYEKIMCVGTGGISTAIYDCARFGWEFIEPGKIFPASYVEETAKKASERRILPGCEAHCGLGWDGVDFYGYGTDLGPCLQKGGNTFQFKAQLVVSRKYRIVGAISATNDCPFEPIQLISEIMADAAGLEFKVPEAPEKKPMPEGYAEKYAGRYYCSTAVWNVSFKDDCVNVTRPMLGMELPFITDAPFDGEKFIFDGEPVKFITDESGRKYFCMGLEGGMSSFGEIPEALPPIKDAWLARDGKQYIVSNAYYSDLIISGLYGSTQIKCDREHNIINFILHGSMMPYAEFPTISGDDDYRAKNFLRGPGSSSRDTSAPVIYYKDGAEHLFMYGFDYIEADALDELKPGKVALGKGDSRPFRVPEGKTYKLRLNGARAVTMGRDLSYTGDSLYDDFSGQAGEGFVILLSKDPVEIEICE